MQLGRFRALSLVLGASVAASAAGSVLAPAVAEAANQCSPARAMVVLDRSSSMTATIGGQSKWKIATTALDRLSNRFESSIDLGLMTFPNTNACSPGDVDVDVGPSHRAAIMSVLATPPPSAGNWTPMAQTLDVAALTPSLLDATRTNYVILVTDGWQYCIPYAGSTRFAPVGSVERLRAAGIKTYVVGFGGGVDILTLNQMAVAGGTAPAGCNPMAEDSSSCYYQADDSAELEAALEAIGVQVSTETCDGVDNDCDGLVDEDLTRECATACGSGVETCVAGTWQGCDAQAPVTEICDGTDNDCDGAVDPGCECTPGTERACEGSSVGVCRPGTQTCGATGTWGACDGAVGPSPEVCDGQDNDCDGMVDAHSDGEGIGADPLCPAGQICSGAGGCVDPQDPSEPPPEDTEPGATAGTPDGGCGCDVGGAPANMPLGTALLLMSSAIAFVIRRRK